MNEFILAKKASEELRIATTDAKNSALVAISEGLLANVEKIIRANKIDLENAEQNGIKTNMLDRLTLDEGRIKSIASDILKICDLPDPIGEVVEQWTTQNELTIKKVRVPFGVIGTIYESRPNVTVDITVLCLKTGNACLLKGGKEAVNTNTCLVEIMRNAISKYLPENSVILLPSNRESADKLIKARGFVDLIVPRGGKGLIEHVVTNSIVPVIETGAGVCHTYVEKSADLEMAMNILINAKIQRPSVCNACETLLVDREIAQKFLPMVETIMRMKGVNLHGNYEVGNHILVQHMNDESYNTEYNSMDLSIKIVGGVDEAIEHINKFGTHHSETIVTANDEVAEKFMDSIDSACVYVNSSTRFSDGGCFGFGAELGNSTQKLHARGPMGLKEMTSYHYKIYGKGQVR